MTRENFNIEMKKIISLIFICAVLLGSVSISSGGNKQSCIDQPSVRASASIENNSDMGGHITKHIRGETQVLGHRLKDGDTMYDSLGDYQTVWSAVTENFGVFGAPCEGNEMDTHASIENLLGAENVMGIRCLSANWKSGVCVDEEPFDPSGFVFVLRKVDGKWIMLTSYPVQ